MDLSQLSGEMSPPSPSPALCGASGTSSHSIAPEQMEVKQTGELQPGHQGVHKLGENLFQQSSARRLSRDFQLPCYEGQKAASPGKPQPMGEASKGCVDSNMRSFFIFLPKLALASLTFSPFFVPFFSPGLQ